MRNGKVRKRAAIAREYFWITLIVVATSALALSCGSDGGSTGMGPGEMPPGSLDGDAGTAGTPDGGPSTAESIVVDVALQSGGRWTFLFTSERTASRAGSGSSAESSGVFEVRLGSATVIAERTAYPLEVQVLAGPSSEVDNLVRWTHMATDAQGRLLGSTDGVTLEFIYGGKTGGGFFANFGDDEIAPLSNTFEGRYANVLGFQVEQDSTSGGCEVVLSLPFCEDSSNSFRQYEHFAVGLGPVAYATRIASFDDSAGFVTSSSREINVELISASFVSEDSGFVSSPWRILPNLPQGVTTEHIVGVADRLYAFSRSEGIFVYESGAGWSTVRDFDPPTGQLFSVTEVEGKVVILADDEDAPSLPCPSLTLLFDPSDGSLSAGAPVPPTLGAPSCAGPPAKVELSSSELPSELAVLIGGSATSRFFYGYSPSSDEWTQLGGEIMEPVGAVRTTDVFGAPLSPYCSVGGSGPKVVTTFQISDNGARRLQVFAFDLDDTSFEAVALTPGCDDRFVSAAPWIAQFKPNTPSDSVPPSLYNLQTQEVGPLPPSLLSRTGRFATTRFADEAVIAGGVLDGEPVVALEILELGRFLP